MAQTVVRSLPVEAWRCFVDEQPAGNIFHTPEMFEVFARTEKHRPELWATVDEDRVLALLLPVRITLMNGLLRHLTTRSIVYGNVLSAPGAEGEKALALLMRSYAKAGSHGSVFTELRNLDSIEKEQPILCRDPFVYEEHLNYLIDLQRPVEKIFEGIGQRTRKNIRRGLNRGQVTVKEVTERDQVAACYDLLCRTYQHARVPLADYSLFEAAFDVLYPKRMIRYTLAYVEQTPVCVSVELLYKNVVFGWYGGVDRDFSSYVPNELIMWHILKWSAENGYHVYDWGGAGRPTQTYGVRDFKAKFGGQLVNCGRSMWVPNPFLLRLSEFGYDIYRRLVYGNMHNNSENGAG